MTTKKAKPLPIYNYNGIKCVAASDIIVSEENPEGVVKKYTYNQWCQRNKVNRVRRGCYKHPALIEYESIPREYKSDLQERGFTYEYKRSVLHKLIEVDLDAREFYASYMLADGRFLPAEKQQEYAENAEILNAIRKILNDRLALRKALGGTTKNLWTKIAEQTKALRPEINHTLPDNERRLKDRLSKYKHGGYESLISGKWLNANAKKVVDDEQQAALRRLIRDHRNLDNAQIRDLYNIFAEKLVWDKISSSTVANYRKKWNLETFGGRHGETAFDNSKAMIVKRKAPTLPLVYWTVDGWDVELLYQKTTTDKKGNSVTTYHNRLTVVVVLDPCQKYPVGFAIGERETPALIREALRNAVNHTAELFGGRHRVGQLQPDRYAIKNLKPFYEALAEVTTPAKARNSKSKVIEPYFKRLNKKYCQLMPNWSGFGVTARKENQPNADYLNKIRHSFPDEAGVRIQIERIIDMERQAAVEKYQELYKELPDAEKYLLNEAEYLHLLGETTGYTNRLSHAGMIATIEGQKWEYDSYDPKFRLLAHIDWTLKYDPVNPERVLAINDDASMRFLLAAKHEQPMALRDRTETDAQELSKIRDFNKNMKGNILEGMKKDHALVDRLFSKHPGLNDTLAKLVLCDSNGQHKNQKSALRLASANAEEVEERSSEWEQSQEEYLNEKTDVNKYL